MRDPLHAAGCTRTQSLTVTAHVQSDRGQWLSPEVLGLPETLRTEVLFNKIKVIASQWIRIVIVKR